MSEDDWKELKIRRDLAAMQKSIELVRRSELQKCLDEWRAHVLRRSPGRRESRAIIQDQVYEQVLLETVGSAAA